MLGLVQAKIWIEISWSCMNFLTRTLPDREEDFQSICLTSSPGSYSRSFTKSMPPQGILAFIGPEGRPSNALRVRKNMDARSDLLFESSMSFGPGKNNIYILNFTSTRGEHNFII